MTVSYSTIAATWMTLGVAFLLVGCGGSSVMVNPDFNNPELHSPKLKRDNVRIVKVIDGRPTHSSQIGTARVGMMNREVPYLLNGDLSDVVRTMLDTLIVGRHDQAQFIPILVSVDMFEVGETTKLFAEEGYFACNLRFNYPVTPDSTGQQVVFIKQTERSAIDVTNAIEPLIYKGMAEGARRFVEETLDKSQHAMMISQDSVEITQERDSVRVAAFQQTQNSRPKQITITESNRVKTNELSFHYVRGNKIKTGILGSYRMLSQAKGSEFLWGVGISFTYYDIDNTQDLVRGTFISFGATLVTKYYFSSARTTAYIGGNLALSGGTERINSGFSDETSFFLGPTIQEVLGISIGRKVSLEFGSFQLAHFGSKLLPSDIGLIAGVSFGL